MKAALEQAYLSALQADPREDRNRMD